MKGKDALAQTTTSFARLIIVPKILSTSPKSLTLEMIWKIFGIYFTLLSLVLG